LSSDNFPQVLDIQALLKAFCSKKFDERQLKAPDGGKRLDGLVAVGMEQKKQEPCHVGKKEE